MMVGKGKGKGEMSDEVRNCQRQPCHWGQMANGKGVDGSHRKEVKSSCLDLSTDGQHARRYKRIRRC